MAELFGNTSVCEGCVVFEASQPVFTWGSVIDSYSGDGIFVRGIEPVADVKLRP